MIIILCVLQEGSGQGYFQFQIHFENLVVPEGCLSIAEVLPFFVDELDPMGEKFGGYTQDASSS